MRAVSVVSVRNPAVWAELEGIEEHTLEHLDPLRRVVGPGFEKQLMPRLQKRGQQVLVRFARREREEDAIQALPRLPAEASALLHAAQRHALGRRLLGKHWLRPDEAHLLRLLQGERLIAETEEGYLLAEDLPDPPQVVYDFEESWMPPTDDLSQVHASSVSLLHDLAALAAALVNVPVRRTLKGDLSRTDARKLAKHLGVEELEGRWTGALRALEALGVVSTDPITRELYLDLGLEPTLAGTTAEAMDRLIHRLVDRDLHTLLPAVRSALAGPCVDRMIFLELLEEQHRTVLFRAYPALEGEQPRELDTEAWERVETRLVKKLIRRLELLGLVRRASGVFAPSADGAVWAGHERPLPPIWVSSDLQVTVPPEGVTPWERFQLERLGRCVSRDVVDRYRLERGALSQWLVDHDLDQALELLERRCPALPAGVRETLQVWGEAATRVVLTRGVLLP